MKTKAFLAMILLSSALTACDGDGGDNNAPPITVSVSADPATIQPGATAQVTATVRNDTNNLGVKWTVSCSSSDCGSVSPTTTSSDVAATYWPPSGHPPANIPVNITATSLSDSTAAASTQVTVTGGVAITELDSDYPIVLAGSSIGMRVILVNDADNRGVTWSISCDTPPCGTVAPSTSTSGVVVRYTAPEDMPAADLHVSVTATAASNPAVQAAEDVTVSALAVAVAGSDKQVAAGGSVQL